MTPNTSPFLPFFLSNPTLSGPLLVITEPDPIIAELMGPQTRQDPLSPLILPMMSLQGGSSIPFRPTHTVRYFLIGTGFRPDRTQEPVTLHWRLRNLTGRTKQMDPRNPVRSIRYDWYTKYYPPEPGTS